MTSSPVGLISRLPFRAKLTLLTGSSVALALLLACVGLFGLQYKTDRELAKQRHTQLASVIASNAGPAVLFGDREVALETLSSAHVIEDVLLVEVVLSDGEVFSQYLRPLPDTPLQSVHKELFERDILIDGEKVGSLRMLVAHGTLFDIIAETWGAILGLFLLCLALATLVSRALNQMAFRPIEQLVAAMRSIEKTGSFAMRLPPERDRDFAVISTSFNSMLSVIERSSEALKKNANDLREARDEAEQASTAKSQFLANMSHELRTPLNAILGYAEVLREELDANGSEQSLEDVQWIHTSAQQLLELINGILDLSKIEAGKMELDCHDFKIGDLVAEVGKMLEPLAMQKGNRVTVHVAKDLGKARTDSVKLRQALLNLGSNACKFTEDGQIMIAARRAGEDVAITVSDTGIGMSEDTIARLFEPFSQADTSTTRRFGGTGLGLAITQRFAELLNGRIEVDSQEGIGSSFTLTIPLFVEASEGRQESGAAVATPSSTNLAGSVARDSQKPLALVIDDEPSATQLITRIAEQAGYQVITAEDGATGLSLMRQHHPSLVLLDLSMPHCDGWEVLAKVEKDAELSKIPVVVVSVSDEERRTYDAGASDHLTKPISSQQIKEVLDQYAQRRSGRVLLVENDPATAALYSRGLQQMGYDVAVVYDGAAAFGLLQGEDFEIVVTDLDMAGSSGFELIENISQIPHAKRPSVFVVTGLSLEEAQSDRLEEQVVRIFAKNGLSPRRLAMEVADRCVPAHPSQKVA